MSLGSPTPVPTEVATSEVPSEPELLPVMASPNPANASPNGSAAQRCDFRVSRYGVVAEVTPDLEFTQFLQAPEDPR